MTSTFERPKFGGPHRPEFRTGNPRLLRSLAIVRSALTYSAPKAARPLAARSGLNGLREASSPAPMDNQL
jgi:hypothetical protein